MRASLLILIIPMLSCCSRRPLQNVVAIKFDQKNTIIDIHSIEPEAVFTKDFIYYLIEKFPAASNVIFFPNDPLKTGIILSDSTYEFGIISYRNKVNLINSLPKNLSKQESENYFKRSGFFIYKDSVDLARQDSFFEESTKWENPSSAIEAEYARFYTLIKSHNEYLIIAPKLFVDEAPW